MEKHVPHCRLNVVKALVSAGKVRATHSARQGAASLGLELADVLAVLMALRATDFYKSMTTRPMPTTLSGRTCTDREHRWGTSTSS